METLINFFIGILGILLYTLVTAKDFILLGCFDVNKWRMPWVWSISLLFLISIILHIEPNTASAIKTFTGLDISTERVAYLTLAIGIISLTKKVKKKELSNPEKPNL